MACGLSGAKSYMYLNQYWTIDNYTPRLKKHISMKFYMKNNSFHSV